MTEQKKKLFGPKEIIIFIVVSLLLGYIGLVKTGGGGLFERTETVEIIDNAKQPGGQKRIRTYQPSEDDESVEAILRQMAQEYSKGKANYNTEKELIKAGVSEDEMDYLEAVRNEIKQRKEPEQSTDWFTILKASRNTYSKVKSVFEKAGIDVGVAEKDVASAIVSEVAARSLYNKLEETFDIPEKDSKAFAQKGKNAISDWARFVEEKTQ